MKNFLIPLRKKIVQNMVLENKRRFGYNLLLVNHLNPSYYCLRTSAFSNQYDEIQLFYEEELILQKQIPNDSEIDFSMDGRKLFYYTEKGKIVIWQLNEKKVDQLELQLELKIALLQINQENSLLIQSKNLKEFIVVSSENGQQTKQKLESAQKKKLSLIFESNCIIFVSEQSEGITKICFLTLQKNRIINIGTILPANKYNNRIQFAIRQIFFFIMSQNYDFGTKRLYMLVRVCGKLKIIRQRFFFCYHSDFLHNDNSKELSLILKGTKFSVVVNIVLANAELQSLGKFAKQTVTEPYLIYKGESQTNQKIKSYQLMYRIEIEKFN